MLLLLLSEVDVVVLTLMYLCFVVRLMVTVVLVVSVIFVCVEIVASAGVTELRWLLVLLAAAVVVVVVMCMPRPGACGATSRLVVWLASLR